MYFPNFRTGNKKCYEWQLKFEQATVPAGFSGGYCCVDAIGKRFSTHENIMRYRNV